MTCVQVVVSAILSLNPNWTEAKAEMYAQPMCEAGEKYDIDPLIGVAIANHETGWNPNKIYYNKNGSLDLGVMQFNCERPYTKIYMKWRREWCSPKNRKYLMTIEGNIRASFKELSVWKSICIKRHEEEKVFLHSDHIHAKSYMTYNFDRYPLFANEYLQRRRNSYEENNWFGTSTMPHPLKSYYESKYIEKYDIGEQCLDCFKFSQEPALYNNIESNWNIGTITKNHWWVRHYNWGLKNYSWSVLYIYKTLVERRIENLKIVTSHYYRILAKKDIIKRCVLKNDMCLKEYKQWRLRQRKRWRRHNS